MGTHFTFFFFFCLINGVNQSDCYKILIIFAVLNLVIFDFMDLKGNWEGLEGDLKSTLRSCDFWAQLDI